MKDIDPKDSYGQFHGYQEWYHYGKIWIRGTDKHGVRIGYRESHKFKITGFYIR